MHLRACLPWKDEATVSRCLDCELYVERLRKWEVFGKLAIRFIKKLRRNFPLAFGAETKIILDAIPLAEPAERRHDG